MRRIRSQIVRILIIGCVWGFGIAPVFGHDPLTDKRRDPAFGKPSEGLGTLLSELAENHPVKLSFQKMLN